MALRMDGRRATSADIRKLARGRVDNALDALRDSSEPHVSVHRARKCFKEMRAILRLFRPALGRRTVRFENAWYRDQARALAGFRDAQAVIETVEALEKSVEHPAQRDALQACRQTLAVRRDRIAEEGNDLASGVAQLIKELDDARQRIGRWPMKADGADTAVGGFERCYRRGARTLRACHPAGDADSWHAWRKRVKDYWYHVQILQPLWPPVMKALQGELKTVADLLGDDHDLTILDALLQSELEELAAEHRQQIHDMIGRRHAALRVPALRLGRRLYVDRPETISRRIRGWWDVWREESAS